MSVLSHLFGVSSMTVPAGVVERVQETARQGCSRALLLSSLSLVRGPMRTSAQSRRAGWAGVEDELRARVSVGGTLAMARAVRAARMVK